MKKWGIFFGGVIFCFALATMAQTDMESMFNSDNKNILYSGEAKKYSGDPMVYIEGISDQARPKNWRDKLKIKLFGSMTIPPKEPIEPLPPLKQTNVQQGIKITPLFGKEKEVSFVPHTSDWNFIIQILNDEDILIQEDIQFIKTSAIQNPVRDWPKQKLTLLNTYINGQEIPLKLEKNKDTLSLNFPELETGIYKIRLNYLIQKSGIFGKQNAIIYLPLTDMGWNLPTASLSGVVLFPQKIKEVKSEFLLGKNHQEIKEAFKIQKENQGNLFFQNTHLIPAHSIIQLNLNLDYDSFIKKGIWEKITESSSFLIFIISLGTSLLYLILNIIEIKIIPISVLKGKKLLNHSSIKNFLIRTGEIWIGMILLFLITLGIAYLMKSPLNQSEILLLIFIPIILVLITDYLVLYPRQELFRKIQE